MLKYYRHQFNFACVLADLLALPLSFAFAFLLRRDLVPLLSSTLAKRPMFSFEYYLPVFVLTSIAILGTLFALGGYKQTPAIPLVQGMLRSARALFVALLLTLALAFLLKLTFMSRTFLVFFMGTFFLVSGLSKHAIAVWYRRGAQRGKYCRMVLLVGCGHQAREVAKRLRARPELGIHLKGYLWLEGRDTLPDEAAMQKMEVPCLGEVSDLPDLLEKEVIDGVIFTGEMRTLSGMEDLFLVCEDLGVETLVAANLFPHLIAQVQLERLEELPLLRFTTVPHNHVALFIKRAFDAIASALALMALSPLLALIALLIKATSRGPVFFVQERMGLNGRRFLCYKFRTMVVDAEKKLAELKHLNEVDGPVFKIRHDPRVTPLGRVLRKSSLDELPQLWNVLKGDMSLVGPRPPIPSEVEKYERWQRRRLSMRPGITCLWQISGRSDLDFDTWMRLDLKYIDDWSLTLDFIILLKTVPAVLSARGAA